MSEQVFSKNISPLFNCADFPQQRLKRDRHGHMRALEMSVFRGEALTLLGYESKTIVKVHLPHYPKQPLYTDVRFLSDKKIERSHFDKETLETNLRKREGVRYLWGGNVANGIEEINRYYPHPSHSSFEKDQSRLVGLDCSGLLYEAMQGHVMRNTNELYNYKNCVETLQPLDLIVYPGHMMIVLSENEVIQSKENRGVFISSLEKELYTIDKRHPNRRFIRLF